MKKEQIVREMLLELIRQIGKVCEEHEIPFSMGFDVSQDKVSKILGYHMIITKSHPRLAVSSMIMQGKANEMMCLALADYIKNENQTSYEKPVEDISFRSAKKGDGADENEEDRDSLN